MSVAVSRLFRLRAKIFLVALTPLSMLLLVAVMGVRVIGGVRADVDTIVNQSMPATTCSLRIESAVRDMVAKTQAALATTEQAEREATLRQAKEAAQAMHENCNQLRTLSLPDVGDLITKIAGATGELDAFMPPVWDEIAKNTMIATEGAQERMSTGLPTKMRSVDAALAAFANYRDNYLNNTVGMCAKGFSEANSVFIYGAGAGLVASVVASFLVSRRLARRVSCLVEGMQQIQKSWNLTVRIPAEGGDEIAQLSRSFNAFIAAFHDVIASVSQSTTDVAAAAAQIAAASEEMSAAVTEVSNQAAASTKTADEAGRLAVKGGDAVDQTVSGIQDIERAVSSSATAVEELGKQGQQIGELVSVINDIADQTNLLALNAAIEAARAGEQGRGFAVVADEVRKLADRTATATREITESIKGIRNGTDGAVSGIKAGAERVKGGVELSRNAGQYLKSIVKGATDVAGMIHSISLAAEQAGAGAQEAASAAADLSTKADGLGVLVAKFVVTAKK